MAVLTESNGARRIREFDAQYSSLKTLLATGRAKVCAGFLVLYRGQENMTIILHGFGQLGNLAPSDKTVETFCAWSPTAD